MVFGLSVGFVAGLSPGVGVDQMIFPPTQNMCFWHASCGYRPVRQYNGFWDAEVTWYL